MFETLYFLNDIIIQVYFCEISDNIRFISCWWLNTIIVCAQICRLKHKYAKVIGFMGLTSSNKFTLGWRIMGSNYWKIYSIRSHRILYYIPSVYFSQNAVVFFSGSTRQIYLKKILNYWTVIESIGPEDNKNHL